MGQVFFSILVVGLFVLLRRINGFKSIIYAALFSVMVYCPWILYQKLIDPPGNRLIKWHIAGRTSPDSLSVLQSLLHSFKNVNLHFWFEGRLTNFGANFSWFFF